MNMALTQTSGGDSNKSALLAEFLQRGRSHVTHTALKSADQLVGQPAQRALVRHATLHAFRHGFAALGTLLRVTVGGARLHRPG